MAPPDIVLEAIKEAAIHNPKITLSSEIDVDGFEWTMKNVTKIKVPKNSDIITTPERPLIGSTLA